MSLVELFCAVDDFVKAYTTQRGRGLPPQTGQRRRQAELCESEIMTIAIQFHCSGYRCFKHYYEQQVLGRWRRAFPGLVSYARFITLLPRVMPLLWAFAQACCGSCTGTAFIDSTALRVCHNRRIQRHRVFAGAAERGQTSTGWFFGFKLHLVVNQRGDILAFQLTPGNIDDRVPVEALTARLQGKLVGDKGYLSTPLFDALYQRGLQLLTNLRSNMKNHLIPLADKFLLRKRWLIETIFDQLKNLHSLDHTRHRSPLNFVVNALCALIAYMSRARKPSIRPTPPHVA